MPLKSDITLLIATKDRSDFLTRLLSYYQSVGFNGRIIIGDSSERSHIDRIKPVVNKLQADINIEYREHPGESNVVCVKNLVDLVDTKYMAVLQDDDFIVPSGIERCMQFLDGNPKYAAAHGSAALFSLDSSGVYGRINLFTHFTQRSAEGGSAAERLLDHLANYSVNLFAVHRVEAYRAMYENVLSMPDRAFGGELLPCCLSVMQGKHKLLNCLYLLRQAHDVQNRLADTFDWVTSRDWLPSYQAFQDCLTNELSLRDGIDVDEGRKLVKQAFWSYLRRHVTTQWNSRYTRPKPIVRLKRAGLRLPGVRWAWLQTLSLLPVKRNKMILPSIMRRTSPYHADFMPVYRAVTGSDTAVSETGDENQGIPK